MSIILRNYQEKAITQLGHTGTQVLSICPGGGKTYTAIEYINRSSFKRVLILAHGTNVLKSQWEDELTSLGIEHSTDLNSDANIVVSLPHSLEKAKKLKFDLIIVDEAHEFYYADMVQEAIKRIKPKCALLLTGTPSKFIKNELKPVIISGCEVFNEKGGYLSNTYFGAVKSTYKLDQDDYSEDGETINDAVFTEKETVSSLKALVRDMLKRLRAPDVVKNSPNFTNVVSYVGLSKVQEVFARLGKTMIACKDINQANSLAKHLVASKVNTVVSESKTDVESVNIKEFMTNDSVQVLLVVRRGILGFNFPALVNVVDFTMSRNIDRIYQLYARVLRTHPDAPNKFFFRMCSALNPAIDAYYLQAAMCLNSREFMSKWNGKNLKQMPILVPKKKTERSKSTKDKKPSEPKNVSIDGDVLDFVLGLELLTELTMNPDSKYWYEFGYMKFGEVVAKLNGTNFVDVNPEEKKEKILEFIRVNGRRPSHASKDLTEKRLGWLLNSYTLLSSNCFDITFKTKVDALCPIIDTVSINKQKILEFIKANNRRPRQKSKDLEENRLGGVLSSYTSRSSNTYDLEFKNKVDALCPSILQSDEKKKKILEFIRVNNRRPSPSTKDLEEKKLVTYKYTSPSSSCYDPEFKNKVDSLCPIITVSVTKEKILEFIRVNNRRPNKRSKDLEENRLGQLLSSYISPSSRAFDTEFKQQIYLLKEK